LYQQFDTLHVRHHWVQAQLGGSREIVGALTCLKFERGPVFCLWGQTYAEQIVRKGTNQEK
jgi:hypothetical protein